MSDSPFRDLFEFRSRWDHLADEHLASIGRFEVPATVGITTKRFEVEDATTVTITTRAGPSDGNVGITETHILNLNFMHLDFDPRYQDYDFEQDTGALLINGKSKKMGKYSVRIQPSE